ncbi:MAG: DUF2207 domain-containing protein [Clostridiales bacterium]|nr:DUF2207 domain-containing protein [Clostridiales bacterium]
MNDLNSETQDITPGIQRRTAMNRKITAAEILRRASAILAAATLVVMMVPIALPGAFAADNTMETPSYEVEVNVAEDNSYDYHEHLDINYIYPHHGIYRYIPMKGQRITKINVPGYDYETYTSYGNLVVKIGSGDYTLTGLNSYDISYNIAMFEDDNEEKDMLLLNLIPADWETAIDSVSCKVTLPKETDLSTLQVFSGPYGATGNDDNVKLRTSEDGLTITATAKNLPANHGVTVTLELPQGYWQGAQQYGQLGLIPLILFALGPIGAFLLWYLYGRDDHIVKTLEFYPPNDLTPGEIGYIVDTNVDKRDVISTIVFLADKGYMTIEDVGRNDYLFRAVREPGDEVPRYIRTIYKGIFANGRKKVMSDKLGVSFGRKYQSAGEQLSEMFEGSNAVYRPSSWMARIGCLIAAMMPILAFTAWGEASGDDLGMECIIWAGIHIALTSWLMWSVYDKIRSASKVRTVLRCLAAIWFFIAGLGVLLLASDAIGYIKITKAIVISAALVLGTLIAIFFSVIAIARKSNYSALMGKILGFRDFIRTAELDKLNELVEEDPEYFYHIIPYAYVFGLTNKWIKNFEDINIIQPTWYRGSFDTFDAYMMGRMMNNCNYSVSNHIELPVTSHSSGGFSGGGSSWSGGGGFSGGGFSGGGSGGGGGGGW